MRVIIAGSRTGFRYSDVERVMSKVPFEVTTVVSGGARGVDEFGKIWAMRQGIPIAEYIADWGKYGKAAGMYRNLEMAESADALVAIWDGVSKGTAHMIQTARRRGMQVQVFEINVRQRMKEEEEAALAL